MQHFRTIIVRRTLVFLVLLTLSLLSSLSSADAAGQWRDGLQVYVKICSYCHDTNIGPIIKGTPKPAEYIYYIVRNGFRAMPAFRASEIDDETLKMLANYIKSSASQ